MNRYLTYIFQQFTLKSSSQQFNNLVKQQLLELKPVDLTKIYKQLTSSTLFFNELNLLLAKGVLKYSPANCTVELSLPNVMLYQRMFKMAYFAQEQLDVGVAEFINQWIEQGLQNGMGFPVMFEKKKLQKALSFNPLEEIVTNNMQQTEQAKKKQKGKNKLQPQVKEKPNNKEQVQSSQYNYHKLIYQYKSQQKQVKIPTNHKEQQQSGVKPNPQQSNTKKSSSKPPRKVSKQLQEQPNLQKTYQSYMLNVQELTKLLQWSICLKLLNSHLSTKQKKLKLFEFLNSKNRQQTIQEIKHQKLQEFIAQILSPDCLLVFNLIKKYPYITEKELVKLTMLEVLQTRASLNKLLEKGFLNFYNQNARTIVYKVVQTQILQKIYLDTLARTLLNLTLATQRVSELSGVGIGQEKVKDKLIELECQSQRVDDLMILFGW